MNDDLSKLDLFALLDRLEPVPEPPAISLWPETQAWIWVGLAVIAIALWLIRFGMRRRRANAYRREALREIAAVGESPAALALILRRTALAAFPRAEVASIHGEEWLAFLDRTAHCVDFREGVGRFFALAPYIQRSTQEDPDPKALAALAARWVHRHKRDAAEAS